MSDQPIDGYKISTSEAEIVVGKQSDTPRTDAFYNSDHDWNLDWQDFARQLERELNEANKKLAKLSRLIDLANAVNDTQSETELAASATFAEAMAYQNADLIAEERDSLLKIAEELALWYNSACCCRYETYESYSTELCSRCQAISNFNKWKEGKAQ